MAKAYFNPELYALEDIEDDILTASPETGDNDVEDPWGDELEDDF